MGPRFRLEKGVRLLYIILHPHNPTYHKSLAIIEGAEKRKDAKQKKNNLSSSRRHT